MRLYSMHKREFVVVFMAFFACFGLAVFIGLAGNDLLLLFLLLAIVVKMRFLLSSKGPPIMETTPQTAHVNSSEFATGPFIMKTPALSSYSQQLWVIAKLSTSNNDGKSRNSIYIYIIKKICDSIKKKK